MEILFVINEREIIVSDRVKIFMHQMIDISEAVFELIIYLPERLSMHVCLFFFILSFYFYIHAKEQS